MRGWGMSSAVKASVFQWSIPSWSHAVCVCVCVCVCVTRVCVRVYYTCVQVCALGAKETGEELTSH